MTNGVETVWDRDIPTPGDQTIWDRDIPTPGERTFWDRLPSVISPKAILKWRGAVRTVVRVAQARLVKWR